MPEAVIVDAVRTPIGRAVKGSLKDVRADDLAAVPLKALVERNPGVDFAADRRPHDGLRLPGRRAGLQRRPQRRGCWPGSTITSRPRRSTASAPPRCRRSAWPSTPIKAGEGDQYIAAGVEAVSRFGDSPIPFHPQLDGSEGSLYNVYIPMGLTAENVAERCKVSRESQDEWAAISQQRAVAARDSGHFDREIVAVTLEDGTEVTKDDGPRPGTTSRSSPSSSRRSSPTAPSPPATPARSTTAPPPCSSCPPRRRRSSASSRAPASSPPPSPAIRPEIMGLGPIPAVKKVLEQAGMTIDDIDVLELNEAFAAQVVPCRDEWGIDPEKLNPFGGAIALGHPFGMTGARIMTTLLNDLDTLDGTIGLETMCVAGGMGQAMIVERLS